MKKDRGTEKENKSAITKEKIGNILFFLGIAIFAIVVWYLSYNFGVKYFGGENIPIGQEYLIKDIKNEQNSSIIISYYDNDDKKTVRNIIPSDYNIFNFTESNSTMPIMKLKNTDGIVNYWDVYVPKNGSQMEIK